MWSLRGGLKMDTLENLPNVKIYTTKTVDVMKTDKIEDIPCNIREVILDLIDKHEQQQVEIDALKNVIYGNVKQ